MSSFVKMTEVELWRAIVVLSVFFPIPCLSSGLDWPPFGKILQEHGRDILSWTRHKALHISRKKADNDRQIGLFFALWRPDRPDIAKSCRNKNLYLFVRAFSSLWRSLFRENFMILGIDTAVILCYPAGSCCFRAKCRKVSVSVFRPCCNNWMFLFFLFCA